MGAGRSIAVQNFNEQACILGLGAFYTGMTALRPVGLRGDHRLRRAWSPATMWLIKRWHRSNCVQLPATRSSTCSRSRAATSIDGCRRARAAARSAPRSRWSSTPSSGASRGGRSASCRRTGLHPLWATALIFTLASLVIVAAAAARAAARCCARRRCGCWSPPRALTNAALQLGGDVIGDVVRVVLLFYLMPLWTVLLARVVLGERLTRAAALRVALGAGRRGDRALAARRAAPAPGWPPAAAAALARRLARRSSAASSFAFNNVMLRREADRPEEGRALAMFVGGAIVAGALGATRRPRAARSRRRRAPPAAWLLLDRAA